MNNQIYHFVKEIALQVDKYGGKTYFVGGYVRDLLLGIDSKDIDLEVYGISKKILLSILSSLNIDYIANLRFGNIKLKHYPIDIGLPRKETLVGSKHQDFETKVNPKMSTFVACKRRDFTINAMLVDVLTNQRIDHFEGHFHLKNKILHYVDEYTFQEDALRVLRAAQFAARFEFKISEETINLCCKMDLTTLSKERVFAEVNKALLKAKNPSLFFAALLEMQQLKTWFHEINVALFLKNKEKIDLSTRYLSSVENPLYYMYCVICLGMIKHKSEVQQFILKLSNDKKLIKVVSIMTEKFSNISKITKNESLYFTNILFDQIEYPKILIYLCEVYFGNCETFLQERYEKYQQIMRQETINGDTLIAYGFSPNEKFKEYLACVHQLRLQGLTKEQIFQYIKEHSFEIK